MNNREVKKNHEKTRRLLYALTGITLSDNKTIMISNRLEKLKKNCKTNLNMEEILNKVESGEFAEEFINTFTTNKTHFFRECFHFDDFKDRVLKESIEKFGGKIKIFCSASSTGEEPYSIAMTLKEKERTTGVSLNSSIIASDIDTDVLDYAKNGIYKYEKSSGNFPSWIKPSMYFKRRIDKNIRGEEILIKVKDDLKNMVKFRVLNLSKESYPFSKDEFDVIFCRNVLIYFSSEDQNKILKKLFSHLKIGGTLYLGHSENPQSLTSYVERLGQNIFVKKRDFY